MIQVLIVEDDPMVAQINREYISALPMFQVVGHASNGEDALRFLAGNRVDLIVLDIYMPKMDGLKMLARMRAQFNDVDVIFVTAAREKEAILRGLQLGAVDYLIKPFTFERIRQALERYSQRRALLNRVDELNQETLDALLSAPDDAISPHDLPKGIQPDTLGRVEEWLGTRSGVVELQHVASALSITTVTARRYLDYLVSTGAVRRELKYGSVGRPSHQYIVG